MKPRNPNCVTLNTVDICQSHTCCNFIILKFDDTLFSEWILLYQIKFLEFNSNN